ncbi:MAG: cryptochrome/photolyase family protein [Candidatus Thiodiazotropha taylori]|nr:cryptochrome/photolyase family protein [Candidatus Thiodiazotropha taylori]
MKTLRLILGDQLSHSIGTLRDIDKSDVILMAEVMEEASYVKHHKKKIAFIFSAMRHFAAELEGKGYRVNYIKLNNPHNSGSLKGEVQRYLKSNKVDRVVITEPGEYRLLVQMQDWKSELGCQVSLLEDDRFLCNRQEFADWAEGRKELVMEYWYRLVRKKTGLLMADDKPVGGKWNFDRDNRKPLKQKPAGAGPKQFKPDAITQQVLKLVEQKFSDHFGDLDPFWYAVTAKQARQAFAHFVNTSLANYGDYQDAMLCDEPFNYHSIVAQYMNCGLLDALDICLQVENAYHEGIAPLNAVEGFIRQVIGWREYIRGIYWYYMPNYAQRNTLDARRPLPGFYWDAETDMHCMSQVVKMTKQYAYSHHIQRLMITGNFANLAGLDVQQVCDWYLAVYADAYEWVELPNTLGMALYGDDGTVATKPYVSSGAYINRMSDFCKQCKYDVKQRIGDEACPFTLLYWDYLIRHEKRFIKNRRMAMPYRNLHRFSSEEKKQISEQARQFLDGLTSG